MTDVDTGDGAEAVEIGPENIGASVMALRNLDGPLSYSYRDFVASQLEALAAERDELREKNAGLEKALKALESAVADYTDAETQTVIFSAAERRKAIEENTQ